MEEIKAILFDYDNTLGNRYASASIMYQKVIDAAEPSVSDPLLREAMLQDMLTFDQKGNVSICYTKERIEKKYSVRINIPEIAEWWRENHWKHSVLFDHTEDVLKELKKKYRLGVITNGDGPSQKSKLAHTGIATLFECILASGEVPWDKPDERIFRYAAEKLSLKCDECLYVGDTFSNDVYGALHAGMHAVWICSDPLPARTMHLQIPVIHNITQLPEAIYSINDL